MLINIYSDESRQTGHRYMVLGGVWLQADKEILFSEACQKLRSQEAHLLHAFFKWEKVSRSFMKYYKAFVDIFFQFSEIRFNCIIVDTHKIDYAKFHQNDRELAFYKFYFFLFSRNINPKNKYMVFLDRRTNKKRERLSDLKDRLNNFFMYQGKADDDVVSNVEPRECRLYNTLQLADIFIGAIGYEKDGFTTSPAKMELYKYIKEKRLAHPKSSWKFNIWHWRPSS